MKPCEFCGDSTNTHQHWGLVECVDLDACLRRQAEQGDRDAAELVELREWRKKESTKGEGGEMKPDWKDAPEWAHWLAMDWNGEWYWHELEPKQRGDRGEWDSVGAVQNATVHNDDWKNTLEQRP